MSPNRRQNGGQMMIEAMVASVVGVVGILGVVGLLTDSLSKSNEISDRFIATYLAGEGVEIVRNLVDDNYTGGPLHNPLRWNDIFATGNNTYQMQYNTTFFDLLCTTHPATNVCEAGSDVRISGTAGDFIPIKKDSAGTYSYEPGGTPTAFRRVIELRYDDTATPYRVQIISRVTWTAHGQSRTVTMEDFAYDWRRYNQY